MACDIKAALRIKDVPIDRARELLDYDPATGVFRWRISPRRGIAAGTVAGSLLRGRLLIRIDGLQYQASRIAWCISHGRQPAGVVDHEDGDHANNRLANLRDSSQMGNTQNQRQAHARNKTGLLGVSEHRGSGRFDAYIMASGKSKYLGRYDTAEQAHEAYKAEKRVAHSSTCTI